MRRPSSISHSPAELENIKVVDHIEKLESVDVAILSSPSRIISDVAKEVLERGINTIDSYDIHSSIWDLKQELGPVAKAHQSVSIISAGWDPGNNSIVRALLKTAAPRGITHTKF